MCALFRSPGQNAEVLCAAGPASVEHWYDPVAEAETAGLALWVMHDGDKSGRARPWRMAVRQLTPLNAEAELICEKARQVDALMGAAE